MRQFMLLSFFIAFLALENEGLGDECPDCYENNHFQQVAKIRNPPGLQYQRMSERLQAPPQYRPIIGAYHPRVSNRQQFFSRNADHLLDETPPPQPQTQPQPLGHHLTPSNHPARGPQVEIRQPMPVSQYRSPMGYLAPQSPSTTPSTTTTTTTTTPSPPDEFDEPLIEVTSKPSYRPRPVSVRTPTNRAPKSHSARPHYTNVETTSSLANEVSSDDHRNQPNENVDKVGSKNRRGRPRKRVRSTTTTTTTTTTEIPIDEEGDYYDYDQDYDDYDYQATTTTTTTTRRPRGRQRGRGRGGGRRRMRPTEPPTTTTTTTLSPNYKPRHDGRIIDYHADPNFPYELKGADLTDYPFYISIPENNFNCKGRHDGYYANIELKCQVYHHCAVGHQRYDFLCPNYTLFDQTTFTCRFVNTVDCAASMNHYDRNNELYVETTTSRPSDHGAVRPVQDHPGLSRESSAAIVPAESFESEHIRRVRAVELHATTTASPNAIAIVNTH